MDPAGEPETIADVATAPEAIPLRIVHEDEDLIVVDKEPWGFRGEVAGMLETARARGAPVIAVMMVCAGITNWLARRRRMKDPVRP